MRFFATLSLVLGLALPALAEDAPHPCTENPELEACVALAQELTEDTATAAGTSLKEALIANAPAISERLNNAMLKVGEWVEAAEDFAVEQTPLLVKEIIYFEIASEGFWVMLGLMGIGWGIFAFRWSTRNAITRLGRISAHTAAVKQASREHPTRPTSSATEDVIFTFAHYAVPISGGITTVIGIVFVMTNFMDLLKPIVAPRLFLIEYFNALAR